MSTLVTGPRSRHPLHALAAWVSVAIFVMLCARVACSEPPATTQVAKASEEIFVKAGPLPVDTFTLDWHDAARQRDVPARVYMPRAMPHDGAGAGPFPVILFSHGLGGSRDGYSYLGKHWASHGYICVHLTHIGSDTAAVLGTGKPMEAAQQSVADVRNAINRPLDVTFAIDQLTALNATDPRLKGRLDLARIGIAGHSFGGFTTLASAGQIFVLPGGEKSLGDPRIKAAIAMSAPATNLDKAKLDRMYGAIKIPVLNMTGTKDNSPIGETKAEDRRVPFDHMGTVADAYLLTLKDGYHMIFSGRLLPLGPADRRRQQLILMSSTAFWDAYLKGDGAKAQDNAARAWLAEKGFDEALGKDGTFEKKLPGAATRPATH